MCCNLAGSVSPDLVCIFEACTVFVLPPSWHLAASVLQALCPCHLLVSTRHVSVTAQMQQSVFSPSVGPMHAWLDACCALLGTTVCQKVVVLICKGITHHGTLHKRGASRQPTASNSCNPNALASVAAHCWLTVPWPSTAPPLLLPSFRACHLHPAGLQLPLCCCHHPASGQHPHPPLTPSQSNCRQHNTAQDSVSSCQAQL